MGSSSHAWFVASTSRIIFEFDVPDCCDQFCQGQAVECAEAYVALEKRPPAYRPCGNDFFSRPKCLVQFRDSALTADRRLEYNICDRAHVTDCRTGSLTHTTIGKAVAPFVAACLCSHSPDLRIHHLLVLDRFKRERTEARVVAFRAMRLRELAPNDLSIC
jgi:hypothetical protein